MLKRDVRSELVPLPRHESPPGEKERILSLLHSLNAGFTPGSSLILFNPDPGDQLPIRGWPEERFHEVAQTLLRENPGSFAAVIGLAGSRPYAERFIRNVGRERCIDLTGQTKSIAELLIVFDCASLLVTNDSGPPHFASLCRLPSVVIFGPETPALYAPLGSEAITLFSHYSCSPCLSAMNHRHTWCRESRCLQAIPPRETLDACRKALSAASESRTAISGTSSTATAQQLIRESR